MNSGHVTLSFRLAMDTTKQFTDTKTCIVSIICVLLLGRGRIMAAKIGLAAVQTKNTSC